MTRSRVRRILSEAFATPTDTTILYECRRCGATVDAESEPCPNCGVDSIARYEIR